MKSVKLMRLYPWWRPLAWMSRTLRIPIPMWMLGPLACLALVACPSPPNPPVPDSGDAALLGDATPARAMCSNLATLGCAEGLDPSCAVVVARTMDVGLTKVNAACIASATSKEEARACGFVRCP